VDNPVLWMGALSPREMLRSAVWRSLYGELGRFFRSARIREALGSYAMYLGGSPWSLPGLFSILPYGELAYGLWLPEGGVYALVEGMERLADELGVRILKNHRVQRILVEGGGVAGLELADGAKERYPLVVSNVDVPTTREELLDDGARNRWTRMTPGVMTFYWGIRGKVEGLRHHTIFLPEDFKDTFRDLLSRKRIPENLAFYVSVASDTDTSLAPPGDTAAFVLVPTPRLSELDEVDWDAATDTVREKVMARLRSHDIDIETDRIVFEQVWTPDTWRRAFGLYDGSAFGASHTLFQLGPMRARNYDRRIRGLYYVGASTTPGTGLPMVVLGGDMTAKRVLSHVH
jgi:phytoene desaturase